MRDDWTFWAHPEQLAPAGAWRSWVFLGGRGAGKTRAGAEWVSAEAREGRARRIALIAPTFHDVREVMVEGASGLRALPGERPRYEASRRRLVWRNGAQALCFSAQDPESLRGPQFDAAWADEMCFWAHPKETLDTLANGLRLGALPRLLVTSTPRPIAALKRLLDARDTVITRATSWHNAENLSPDFMASLSERWCGSPQQRQELLGELIEDVEGAMWTRADIEAVRVRKDTVFDRIVVAVDPPAGAGTCGIVAAGASGVGGARCATVLADASLTNAAPHQWAARVASLVQTIGAHAIVAEGNNGGEMVRAVLRSAAPDTPVRLVHARNGKSARAEPVRMYYAEGRVRHAAAFAALEDELVLSTVGGALGARLPGAFATIGAFVGRAAGALIGRSIDQQVFGVRRHYEGARLTDLHLQASTEGASIPAVYGGVRIAGQVIWAARFKEHSDTQDVGGKGGGPRATSTTYRYTLSFAVGLCEGRISRIGRAWANGEPLDLSQVSWRLHDGGEDQAPDPLIETIEGAENAPAYRGLAYVVFEDLPLERFGNTIPQLSFEIVHPAPPASGEMRFEERVKGVCLIPGAGEFVYATEPVLRRAGPGQEAAENIHAERDRANLLVSLDQLAADFPNCEHVLIVVAWFGGDLRCGECAIRPGVEAADKETLPHSWRAGGVTRGDAHVVSIHDGAPAFGGTPSDASVLQAIAELKTRGYKVGLYPFVLMDVPAGNGLPDPYGGAEQGAYPWRGRITLDPAAGQIGSPDKTAAAAAQIDAFFGAAAPGDFGSSDGLPDYSGPDEWSYRRFVLHYAKLAALAGGVDAFILGSEMRGVTTARDGADSFPAVDALVDLAGDVRVFIGPTTTLTYAADWSEYFGHQPQDGSNDVFFHLDALWADAEIDAVGVDWYPPLTDWRDGGTHLDAQLARNIHDLDYLEGRIEAGESYDWFYASDADRTAQTRTPITDGAYSEPWVYRAKDLRNFWARAHHHRPGGVRDAASTDWVPESKPIWLIELGCPAVDKGSNAPNLFVDDKSSESALPPFSSGARDDLIQRRTIDAYLRYWDADGENNPASSVDGRPMVEAAFAWCWDARPFPAFPARADVWTDGGAWRRGHWLTGRAGLSSLGEVVVDLCLRAGVDDVDASALLGAVSGYIVDSPADARAALEPLMAAYDFTAGERDGRIVFFHSDEQEPPDIALDELAARTAGETFAQRGDAAELAVEARVRFLDAAKDYLIAGVSARRLDRAEGGVVSIDAPMVLEAEAAEQIAQALLADRRAASETLHIELGPWHLGLEPGDRVTLADGADVFDVVRIEDAETRGLELRRARSPLSASVSLVDPSAPPTPSMAPTPAFSVLDLPPLPNDESAERPLVAVFASPWLGAHDIYAGSALTHRARAAQPAVMGELLWALWPGPVGRWDDGNVVRIKLYGGVLSSASKDAVLDGANAFAIESGDNEWEVVQVRECTLVAPNEYQLRGFLRGQLGSAHTMRAPHPVGARIVKIDQRLARADVQAHEWREPLVFTAPPASGLTTDPRRASATVTLPRAAVRPWAPAHLRARRLASGDIAISWVRCARSGDTWGSGEPPLGAATESYRLDIFDGALVKRTVTVVSPSYDYSSVDQIADFGAPPASLRLRVAQIGADGAPGLNKELTIGL